jgi:hypothetical protein
MDWITQDDLDRTRAYLDDVQAKINRGETVSRNDFASWARSTLGWSLAKIEMGWRWLRRTLGL